MIINVYWFVFLPAIDSDSLQAPTMDLPFDLMAIAAGILFAIIVVVVILALIRKRYVFMVFCHQIFHKAIYIIACIIGVYIIIIIIIIIIQYSFA